MDFRILKIFIFIFLFSANSFAAESLSYSGRLVKADGSPVAGPVDLKIDLSYTDFPNTILCSQNFSTVVLSNGVFHLKLDLVCPGPPIKTLTEILTSVPANFAAALRVKDITNNKTYAFQEIHSMPFASIAETAKQLSQLGAANGDVLKWNDGAKKWLPGIPGGGGTVTSVSGTLPISVATGSSTPVISMSVANTSTSGYLSSADWNSFNSKEGTIAGGSALQYYRGDKSWQTLNTSVVPESGVTNLYFSNARVLGVPLDGFVAGPGVIAATDTVLQAFAKTQGQINSLTTDSAKYLIKNGTDSITGIVTVASPTGFLRLIDPPAIFTDATNMAYVDSRDTLKVNKAGDTISGVLTLDNDLKMKGGANYVTLKAHATSAAYNLFLPQNAGTSGFVLSTDGNGNTTWINPASVANGTDTVTSASIVDGAIVDADINASAAIAQSKIANLSTDLAGKEPSVTNPSDTTKYYRGDKSWQTLNTTAVAEGSNLYFLNARVLGVDLLGLNTGVAGPITAVDTVLGAFGKLQYQVTDLKAKGQWEKNVGDIYYNVGNVGIGTITPGAALDVKGTLRLSGSTSGYVGLAPAAVAGATTYTLPAADGSAGQILKTNGAGVLGWVTDNSGAGAFSGTINRAVTTDGVGALSTSTTTAAELGYVSGVTSSIQTQLNSKQSTTLPSTNILVGNGINVATAVALSGDATLANTGAVTLKNTGTAGTYSSVTTDAQGRVTAGTNPVVVTSVTGTAPVTIGGTASAPVVSMAAATTAVNGYLTSTNWNTFNDKQAALSTGPTINGIVYPANAGQTLQIPLAPSAATDAVNKQYVDSFGQWGTSAGNVYRTTGNVGIGMTAPGSSLDVKGTLRLSGATSGYVGFAPAAAAGATTYTLPTTQGTSGQVLSTNGVATTPTLSWVSVTSGTVTTVTSANADIAVATTTSTPVLTLNSGTGANQIVKLNATSQLPAVDGSLLTSLNPANLSAAVSVAKGGTGLSAGTSGGIPYFNTTTTMASSALLGLNGIMLGGGAGAAPTTLGTGVAGQFLKSAGAAAPAWANLAIGDLKSSVAGNLFPGSSCGAAQTLVYSIVTDSFTCTDLPASATYWSAATGGINYASGNVGIGTSAPSTKFEVSSGSSSVDSTLRVSVPSVATADPKISLWAGTIKEFQLGVKASDGSFRIDEGGSALGTTSRFTIASGGNIGIGTSAPSNKLTVKAVSNAVTDYPIQMHNLADTMRTGHGTYGMSNKIGTAQTIDYTYDIGGAHIFNTGGAERLRILGSGNVGIGTTTPAAALEIAGSGTYAEHSWLRGLRLGNPAALFWESGGTYSYSLGQSGNIFYMGRATSEVGAAGTQTYDFVNNAGKIGIGTAAPAGNLHVLSLPANNTGHLRVESLNNPSLVLVNQGIQAWANWVDTTDSNKLKFGPANSGVSTATPKLTIDVAGNVGIGTTAPASTLDVNGNVGTGARITSLVDGANNAYWLAKGSSAEANRIGFGINADPVTGVVDAVAMRTNGATRLTIDNAGRVGLGTVTPGSILHMANGAPYITFEETDTTQKIFTGVDGGGYWIRQGSTANADILTVRPTGNVGIGITTPGYKLDVQGGNVNSAGAYTNVSDRRLKQDILPLKNSLEKILQLEGVNYYWKDQSFDSSQQVGFIAQEVEKVFPEVVKTDSRGFKAMSYSQLVSPVVSAIKELFHKWFDDSRSIHREMASIKAENTKLKHENEAIKNYLCAKDPKAAICH